MGLCARRPNGESPGVRGKTGCSLGARVGPTWDLGPVGPTAVEQWP